MYLVVYYLPEDIGWNVRFCETQARAERYMQDWKGDIEHIYITQVISEHHSTTDRPDTEEGLGRDS